MSTDTNIYLPNEADIDDVATVIGILAGNKAIKTKCGDSFRVEVKGVKITGSNDRIGHGHISIEAPAGHKLISGQKHHSCFVHLCAGHGKRTTGEQYARCGLLLSGGANEFWQAIGPELVRFFGGQVDLNDCDDIEIDFALPPATDLMACNGDAWTLFQQRMFDLKPVKKAKAA